MLTPEDKHYLLGFSDEQLVDEAIQSKDGHAAAILQERQRQDKLYLQKYGPASAIAEVRTRVRRRRKQLKRLQARFSADRAEKKGGT